ncbi:MAG: LemA family protein, partial [Coriobacteriales bacterium]
ENFLTDTLRSLFAVAEAYPDLKANQNFQQLQSQLEDTEDKISYMRQSYNDVVMDFNNSIQTFPAVLFAGMFGFKQRELFDADQAADQAPKVQF